MPRIGQENLETVMIDFFGALRRGDFEAAAGLLDPGVSWQGFARGVGLSRPRGGGRHVPLGARAAPRDRRARVHPRRRAGCAGRARTAHRRGRRRATRGPDLQRLHHVGGGARCISGRRRRGRKLAYDPAVELALCQREPKRPLDTVTRGEDLRLSERVERGGLTVELHRCTALALSLTTYAR
jgi:hypothetical protein